MCEIALTLTATAIFRLIASSCLLLLLLNGCATYLAARWEDPPEGKEQIKIGTPRSVVEQIIGEPITTVGSVRTYDINTKEGPELWSMPILDVAIMVVRVQHWSEMEKDYQSQRIRWSLVYGPNGQVVSLSPSRASSTFERWLESDKRGENLDLLCQAANSGNADAQAVQAARYRYGLWGTDVDAIKAYEFISLAAFFGNRGAPLTKKTWRIGMAPDDVAEAERLIAEWEPSPAACGSTGEEVTDTVWLERRGKEVDAEATYKLDAGTLNQKVRVKLICFSAHGGFGRAQREFGRHYVMGWWPVQRDHVEGYKWLSLAAASGTETARQIDALAKDMTAEQIAEAERRTAEWQPDPVECELDPTQEAYWSRDELAKLDWVTKEELREIRVQQCEMPLTEAMNLDAESQIQLTTDCVGLGLGAATIWRWRCLAAHQGDHAAQNHVGHYFRVGSTNVQQDLVEAYKWYGLAMGNGNERAAEWRYSLSEQMTPDQMAEAERLVTEWEPNPAECEVQGDN
jgi:TPR repeat protein